MAVYKVPQDVEADDKILGPFSFRQFIYLVIVCLAGAIAWGLGSLFLPLFVIPLPVIVFFGALALPLRKDQPMETYLAAMVSFYLKPHKRLWDPDGIDSLIEITAPKIPEVQRTKDISQDEARRRLSYLSEVVDTQGWAVRGVNVPAPNSAMLSDAYFEAQQTEDIMGGENALSKRLDMQLAQSNSVRYDAMAKIVSGQPTDYFSGSSEGPEVAAAQATDNVELDYNPYPDIQQTVIQPHQQKQYQVPPKPADSQTPSQSPSQTPYTSADTPLADIMNLATNDDLSIATIAREANRIHEKQDLNNGVVISWR